MGEGSEEGRVGRFRRRFEGVSQDVGLEAEAEAEDGEGEEVGEVVVQERESVFGEQDFDWMSEGAKDETVGAKEKQGKAKVGKKK